MRLRHKVALSTLLLFLGLTVFFIAPKEAFAAAPLASDSLNAQGPTNNSGRFNNGGRITPYFTVGRGAYNYPETQVSIYVPYDFGPFSVTIESAGAGCETTSSGGVVGPDFGGATTQFKLVDPVSGALINDQNKSGESGGGGCSPITLTADSSQGNLKFQKGIYLTNYNYFSINASLSSISGGTQENAFRIIAPGGILVGLDHYDFSGYGYRDQNLSISPVKNTWDEAIVFGTDSAQCIPSGGLPDIYGSIDWKDSDALSHPEWNDNMIYSLWTQPRSAAPNDVNAWQLIEAKYQQRGQIGQDGHFGNDFGNGLGNTFKQTSRYMLTLENVGVRNTIRVRLAQGISQFGAKRDDIPPCPQSLPPTCNWATASPKSVLINRNSGFTVNITNRGTTALNSSYSLHQTYWSDFNPNRAGLNRSLTPAPPGYLGPGQSGNFNFNVSRSAPGTYYFDFRMQQNGNFVGENCHLELTVNDSRPPCSIFGGSSYTVPYGGGTVSYGIGVKNGSGDTWNERYFMTEEVNGARNNIGDLDKVYPTANTRKFDITHTVTTTTTFNYIVWVSPGVPGGADGHYYAPATPFYPNIPGPTTVVRDHGHYPPYADHLHWNHSNRIQLPGGHWTGTWVAGHWNGRHLINGHWVGGTWVAGHWTGPWVATGPWVGGEDGHADLPVGPAPGSATCSVTVTVAEPPIYSSAGSFLEASCTAIRGNIWYQGTVGAPRGILRIIRNSDGASMGDVGVGAWDGSGSSTYFNKDPFRSWRLAPHDTYTVQLHGQNSAGDWDPMLYSAPLNGGNPCLRVQSCNITTDTAPEPGQATTATISVTTANSTSVPFDPSYGYSVGFNSTGSSVLPPSGNQSVSIGIGESSTSPPIILNIVANSRIDINADLYYGGAPFQAGSGCSVSIRPATLPYFKSFQGDIKAGGVFKNIDGSCNTGTAKYGAILGYARPTTSGGRRGASTDFGAYALGLIHGRQDGPYGFYGSAINNANYKNLSFANSGNGLAQDLSGGYMAGNATAIPSIGTNHCVTDYFDGASKKLKPTYSPQSSVNANSPPADGNGVDGQYFYQPSGSTYLTITSGSPITGKTTIFVNGNVYISSNITYGGWNPMDTASAPYLTIIAKGNITVAPGVMRLDGLYIAQGGSSPGSGIFATCASPSNPAQPANATEISANCRQQLVVNGAVIAQQAMLLRSNGTLSLALPGDNAETSTNSANAAEIFNYMPSMILIQPNLQAEGSGAITPGLLQGIFSLPPVF